MTDEAVKEQIELILVGRSYVYQMLQVLFAAEPEADILRDVVSRNSRETVSLMFEPDVPEVRDFCACLSEAEKSLEKNEAAYVDALRSEYTRLFIGPAALAAPPWESVYTTQEKILFHEATLEVRRFYYKRNFLPTGYPNVADDHIAIELDFMYRLAAKTLESHTSEATEEVLALVADQRDFLTGHLLKWSGRYAEALGSTKAGPLYPAAARFANFFLRVDVATLDELTTVNQI
jgi:TorA maturation chaperone TorD